MPDHATLGAFLRARRANLAPGDVGLPDAPGLRRVPGLRREELATLSGISVEYYTRLEQGRAHQMSDSVLDALAAALRLTDDEYAHLCDLTGRSRRVPGGPQRVRPELQRLLDVMLDVPAFILGRRADVLAWNHLGARISFDFDALEPYWRNMPRLIFRHPAARELFLRWADAATEIVTTLRVEQGRHPDDPALAALVDELGAASAEFRELWAAHAVARKSHGTKVVRHPLVGELVLRYESLSTADDPDQLLITYTADAGSPSESALRLLASWTADQPR